MRAPDTGWHADSSIRSRAPRVASAGLMVLVMTAALGCSDGAARSSAHVEAEDSGVHEGASVEHEIGDGDPLDPVVACEMAEAALNTFVASFPDCDENVECLNFDVCGEGEIAVPAGWEEDFTFLSIQQTTSCGETARENPSQGRAQYPVCVHGRCAMVRGASRCGVVDHDCPAGTEWREPGCGATLPAGCYAACDLQSGQTSCAAGFTCQAAEIHPCPVGPPGTDSCAACAAAVDLCLPASPTCELATTVRFEADDRQRVELEHDQATKLVLRVENVSNAPVMFDYSPCVQPPVQGLEDYDLWSCTPTTCVPQPQGVLLEPGQVQEIRTTVITAQSTDACHPADLAPGTYPLTWDMPGLTGISVCRGLPAELVVRPRDSE